MKKRVEKPKAKPVAAKNGVTRKELPRSASAALSPHDQLHSLLRGTHAHKVCEPRQS
jgi:hypothetical protein